MFALKRGIFAHGSGSEHELFAERCGNGTTGFHQSLEVRLGSLLEAEDGLASVSALSMTTWQQAGLCDPNSVLVAPGLYFRDGNYHSARTVTVSTLAVKREAARELRNLNLKSEKRYTPKYIYD